MTTVSNNTYLAGLLAGRAVADRGDAPVAGEHVGAPASPLRHDRAAPDQIRRHCPLRPETSIRQKRVHPQSLNTSSLEYSRNHLSSSAWQQWEYDDAVSRRKLVTRLTRSARDSPAHAEESTTLEIALLRERPASSRRRRSNRPGNSQAHEPRNRTIRLWKETHARVRRRDNVLRQRYRGGT